jgi:hypothetical protein
MDRTQAAKIRKHALDAADAINRARRLIFALDKEDQAILDAPLVNIILALHFEFLHAIYIRYPDLRPPDPDRDVIDTAREVGRNYSSGIRLRD